VNFAVAALKRSVSDELGKNLELSFFCTVESRPKSGPVTPETINHPATSTIASHIGLPWEAFLTESVDDMRGSIHFMWD
jgi:hypothetical protein